MVSTLRCGRSNPGSNPGHGSCKKLFRQGPYIFLLLFYLSFFILPFFIKNLLYENHLWWFFIYYFEDYFLLSAKERSLQVSNLRYILAAYTIVRLAQILWIFQQVLLLSYSSVIVWSRFGSCPVGSSWCRRAPSSADRRKQFHQQQRRWCWQCGVWGTLSHRTPSTLVRCSPAFQQLILNRFAFNNAIKFILVCWLLKTVGSITILKFLLGRRHFKAPCYWHFLLLLLAISKA